MNSNARLKGQLAERSSDQLLRAAGAAARTHNAEPVVLPLKNVSAAMHCLKGDLIAGSICCGAG